MLDIDPLGPCNNDMRLNFSGNRAIAVLLRNRFGGTVGNGLQRLRVAGFDFVAQWRALAVGNRRAARAWRIASVLERHDFDGREARHA